MTLNHKGKTTKTIVGMAITPLLVSILLTSPILHAQNPTYYTDYSTTSFLNCYGKSNPTGIRNCVVAAASADVEFSGRNDVKAYYCDLGTAMKQHQNITNVTYVVL